MAFGYFVASLTGELVGRAVAKQRILKHHKQELEFQRRAIARRAHPLTRLGIAGILSTRVEWAAKDVREVLLAVQEVDWALSEGIRLPNGASAGVAVARLRNRALVIELSLDGYAPGDVARADSAAWTVSALDGHRLSVAPILCVIGAQPEVEPRNLPGPSGNPVTVAGPSWLRGVLRQCVGAPRALPGAPPEGLIKAMAVANDGHVMRNGQYCDLLQALNPACWWIVERLFLDDGYEPPLGCVVVGVSGTYVLGYEAGDRAQAVDLARFNADRLRSYLPFPGVVPVVVSFTADPGTDIQLTGRNGVFDPLIINPSDTLRLVLNSRLPALLPAQIHQLIAPLPGWWRRAVPGTTRIEVGWEPPFQ
jgi:hypothetical protein